MPTPKDILGRSSVKNAPVDTGENWNASITNTHTAGSSATLRAGVAGQRLLVDSFQAHVVAAGAITLTDGTTTIWRGYAGANGLIMVVFNAPLTLPVGANLVVVAAAAGVVNSNAQGRFA